MKFGKRLKNLRISRNLTQKDIADLLNVGVTTISNYETGRNEPSHEKLKILANYFNTTTDYLLGITDNPSYVDGRITDDDIFEVKVGDSYKQLDKKSTLESLFQWLIDL